MPCRFWERIVWLEVVEVEIVLDQEIVLFCLALGGFSIVVCTEEVTDFDFAGLSHS